MKRFLIVPSLVLAVLLALCILNAAALNRRTGRWMDQADRIAQLAEQQRWDMAREAMDALSDTGTGPGLPPCGHPPRNPWTRPR